MFTKDTETRSLEEQAQLVRVFKYLSVEIPLRRVERKIKKLQDKLENWHTPGGNIAQQPQQQTEGSSSSLAPQTTVPVQSTHTSQHVARPQKRKSKAEYEAKIEKLIKEQNKFQAILMEDNNSKELFHSRVIDVQAVHEVYDRLGCIFPHSRTSVEDLVWEIDDSLDGHISYEEFLRSYMRSRNDRTGLEPSEIFFLTCFLMYDKECVGKIAIDDAMRIFYMKYGEAKEEEMEAHFGRMLEEGTHFLSFTQYREAILKRQGELIDLNGGIGKPSKYSRK